MIQRLSVATAVLALVTALFAPVKASAELGDGWDYRALALSGTYKTVVGQFAGDGATDILFYAPGSAGDSLWIGHKGARTTGGSTVSGGFTKVSMSIGGDFVPVAGDFGGDDYDDILFYGVGSAVDSLWISANIAGYFDKTRKVNVGGTYQPKVLRDYRSVGAKDDILFLGPGSAKDYYWHFTDRTSAPYNAPGTYTSRELNVNGAYQLVIGDFSGDYIEDVVLYQQGTAPDYKWVSTAGGAFAQTNLSMAGSYQPVTIFSELRDGILWWGNGSGPPRLWRSTGSAFQNVPIEPVDVAATVVSAGLDGAFIEVPGTLPAAQDRYFHETTADDFFTLAGTAHDQTTARPLVGDFDDDGYIDVAWYGPGTQPDELWFTNPEAGAPAGSGRWTPEAIHSKGTKATPIIPR